MKNTDETVTTASKHPQKGIIYTVRVRQADSAAHLKRDLKSSALPHLSERDCESINIWSGFAISQPRHLAVTKGTPFSKLYEEILLENVRRAVRDLER